MLTRRQFLLGLAGGAALGGAPVGYSTRIEPHWLDVAETTIPLPPTVTPGPPLRVAHLSDLHACRWSPGPYLKSATEAAIGRKPDLVCLTGDYFTCHETWNDLDLIEALKPLAQAVPTFATLGNHDGGPFTATFAGEPNHDRIASVLFRAGVTWLHNRTVELPVKGRTVRLTGMGDLWNNECRPEIAFAFPAPTPGTLGLALSHNPDSKEFLKPYPWDLLLCGHTHGGQCGLPGIGQALAPVRDKRYLAGLYPYDGRHLHITRGVGNLHGVRFLCRPEVSLLTLV